MIWGDDDPVFADEAQMQPVLGGILSRYNQIRHEIMNGTFEPILSNDAELSPNFGDGLKDQAAAWARGTAELPTTSIPSVNLTP